MNASDIIGSRNILMGSPNLPKVSQQGQLSSSKIRRSVDIQKEIRVDPERAKLYDVAKEFQSIFINMMLKSMRSTLNRENDMLYGGNRQDIFEDFLYDEYAKKMSNDPGFHLSDSIYEEMTRSMPPVQDQSGSNPPENSSGYARGDSHEKRTGKNPYNKMGYDTITTDQLIDDRFLNRK